ncbi:tRNA 2-thiouridine synthesizing protein A [Rhodovulum bhavnagarense]|uniref:tRNA 2-thiouridine synthesizing protein A n=1 Tax=Rhodovulum bhavnagarense TaxID=992286 RepID=A0A4R2RNC9_9RHOB|nr:sulfurtransferase TusA family protein [Rhodovulum bhavnagarense]TCP61291.1 tRNA 2-thiouridine synthesizing protein A [Rhodovulum bhavnagarense]
MNETIEIDARGLRCPLPVLRLQKALRQIAPGATVQLMTDDPVAVVDIPHFCIAAGHILVETQEHGAAHVFIVRRTPVTFAKDEHPDR